MVAVIRPMRSGFTVFVLGSQTIRLLTVERLLRFRHLLLHFLQLLLPLQRPTCRPLALLLLHLVQ